MRSYGQFCALAKALETIGDRWTLLIVRELMIRGACRYTDLRTGLPGIATNLLAERLKEMEAAGLVVRESAPPPIATDLFRLTARGEELDPVIAALGLWGAPLLAKADEKDAFRPHWMALPVRLYVRDKSPAEQPVKVEMRVGREETLTVETVGDGSVRARAVRTEHPDARLEGPPQVMLGLMMGKMDLAAARAKGLKYEGDPRVVGRFGGK
jgi:DNA-binding HxlR family transcriptional regulator